METTPDLDLFGRRYSRFTCLAKLIALTIPHSAQPAFARLLGRRFSPFCLRSDMMKNAMRAALGLDASALDVAWSDWLENHGLFAVSIFHYANMTKAWVGKFIRIESSQLLDELALTGGLVLTYHCQHQNTIAALIGRHCGNITPLATTPESSPLFPYVGEYIKLINRDSQHWFGKGQYLFVDQPRQAVRTMRQLLANRRILLALCDSDYPTGVPTTLFGRRIRPSAAAIKLALEYRKPIVAALMVPEDNGLTMYLSRLSQQTSVAEIVSSYIGFLESHLRRQPACWQGWEWWVQLPAADIRNAH